jgi:tripartite-type tricarboxylate transporter receptor subunit TctC
MKTFVMIIAGALAAALLPAGGWAQTAGRPLRIVVPAAAGGPTDVVARVLAPVLSRNLGRAVVVENRGGAGGIVGTEAVAKATPDGNTVALVFISHAVNPALHRTLPYDTLRDFVPIVLVGYQPLLLVANPSLPVENPKDVVALAKSRPEGLAYAADMASAPHLAAELFKNVTGAGLVHIPYKGNGPALSDTIGGQVPLMFNTINTSLPHVKAGRLKALAVTSARRSPLAVDIPTMAEAGFPGIEVTAWYGVVAPAGVPAATVSELNAQLVKALQSEEVRERFAAQGVELSGGTPAEFDAFLRLEIAKWGKIVRAAGMTAN